MSWPQCDVGSMESQNSDQCGCYKQGSRHSESILVTKLPCALARELQEGDQLPYLLVGIMIAALDSTHAYWVELSFSYNDTTTMIRGVKGPWDPCGVKHTFKNFFSSAWGQADFQGRRNVMTQATCGNVVGLCLGSSSEWASLWIRGSQQYIKTGHDREEHRTDSDIVFLLKTAFPLSLCCS